ncbi:R3GEF-like protein [Mya arenaria]|uniref:R3GEF-like protein n=1 Tax=Mya arenaria TaxID=6604 RepID=A0ABY7EF20_MYAAR|nr:R3GEF-like protein [Mya arenaria]
MIGSMYVIVEENKYQLQKYDSDGEMDMPVKRRGDSRRGQLRHAFSEALPNEDPRRRSATMTEAKEYAYSRLQQELNNAQSELKLKDEECEKLLKVEVLQAEVIALKQLVDDVCFEEFKSWRHSPSLSRNCPFIARIAAEDICTCLNFTNTHLAERVLTCVENNSLAIEPIPGDTPYMGKCELSQVPKVCKYKVKLGEDNTWNCISQHCRNRIRMFFTKL